MNMVEFFSSIIDEINNVTFCFILIIESVARFFPIFLSSAPNKMFKLFIYLHVYHIYLFALCKS